MNIKETNLKFGSISKRSKTNRIILHHAAAGTCGAATIHQWHLSNGWAGIGYHFVVRKDGTIERGRPENTIGAHASGSNSDSIGICFEGNFGSETMGAAQKQAGKELVSYLKKKYDISKVQKHSDVYATACPGKNFPFAEITGSTASSGTAEKPSATAGKTTLTVDGKWGTATTKLLQRIFGTVQDGIVSFQRAEYRQPGCYTGWQWVTNPSGSSDLIRAIQRLVGATVDGWLGPDTIRAMQKYWGTVQDGKISAVSDLVKAMQRWANSQAA